LGGCGDTKDKEESPGEGCRQWAARVTAAKQAVVLDSGFGVERHVGDHDGLLLLGLNEGQG
jgi:hypothetical protein